MHNIQVDSSLKARSGVTGGRAQFSNYDKQITCMADMH